jgi:hypothetical protein
MLKSVNMTESQNNSGIVLTEISDPEEIRMILDNAADGIERLVDKYVKTVSAPEDDREHKVTSAIYVGMPTGFGSDFVYAFPYAKGWEHLAAEWLSELNLMHGPSRTKDLRLYNLRLKDNYLGNVYWGPHIELGSGNFGKNELLARFGKPYQLLRIDEVPELDDENYTFELVVPRDLVSTKELAPLTEYDALMDATLVRATDMGQEFLGEVLTHRARHSEELVQARVDRRLFV